MKIPPEKLNLLEAALSPDGDADISNTVNAANLPGQKAVTDVLRDILGLLFPGCHGRGPLDDTESSPESVRVRIMDVANKLADQTTRAFAHACRNSQCQNSGECVKHGELAAMALLNALPSIREALKEDTIAAYEGDPAAVSTMEVVMSYPGLLAIAVHRVAHELYKMRVPMIPRIMSEYAHTKTGIDIHPGAKIGRGFFIDHGTGVVVGETCTIGDHVKLYQGVTLGALSFAKDADGKLVKGVKRHPDVEDGVIIYAGATILGGNTRIGRNSVIGANVWLVHSVPENSKVYNQEPAPVIR